MILREKETDWHCLEVPEVLELLGCSPSEGLSEEEAAARLRAYGHNRIREEKPPHPLSIFLNQFRDFMIYVLIAAALISGLILREFLDAAVIMFIVMANGILGFIQEFRAEKALESLRRLSAPTARVVREGKERMIPSQDLVPGDLILLEAGDRIPADARVLESHGLRADEASLTGESDSVDKRPETLRGEDLPLGDRLNMVFTGTHIVHGRGTAVVVETGKKTQLGRIAEMIGEAEEERTPLQKELARTGKRIALLCLGVCAVVFLLGGLRGQEWSEMFLFSVSLAVAAIPEGLPAIVTIALALGVRRMADRNALLRRLPAVETLGCADVICTDKTGTLTRNQMEVQELHVPEGPPLRTQDLGPGEARGMPGVHALLTAAVLCNDAREQEGEFLGEATEVGLLRMARDLGFSRQEAASFLPRVEEIPFESERKMMSTIHEVSDATVAAEGGHPLALPGFPEPGFPYLLLCKGAPEAILERCDRVLSPEGPRELSEGEKARLEGLVEDMAERSLRTLAFACRPLEEIPKDITPEELERGLAFLGMVGMMDPPRPEVYEALDKCRRAGIRVVMITGDHAATARAIARELNILTPGMEMITGPELARMSEEELAERVEDIAVYARVSPADKVKIVRAWKSRGKTVAMTGDGVNDAPALKNADIGVAMGITGTDVSKEASDMVLSDDNFATIVNAVEEGRVIYDNLKKFIYFLLSCNMSEVVTMFLGMLFASVTPLRAVQVLWMNLVTDGFPAMALGVDTPAPDIMSRPPRDPSEGILSWEKQVHILTQGFILSLGALAAFFISRYVMFPSHVAMAQTVVFTTLVLSQLLHAFNSRSETLTFTEMSHTDNRALLAALTASAGLQVLVVTVPPLMRLFGTVNMGPSGWGLALACSLFPVALIDRLKILLRRKPSIT
ncbi:calcium-translocating P-type ATPase, PMCA-type [Candidatus Solincola tengchongensis]|uniref:calcium-translocating P-type ATPase, PMCA-type n=1 Tax=Candidatus Solincola tengchongensis TaxID=2900693 RepID=UPI00257B20FA|nr:calcium-translocating P-type ATPase, PMCA-type [Candidatus Solincola tengchongensis]